MVNFILKKYYKRKGMIKMENVNQIQLFTNSVFGEVRAIKIEDKVWFIGRDTVKSLGYETTTTSYTYYINKFVKEKYMKKVNSHELQLFGIEEVGRKGEILVDKYGATQLVMNSKVIGESKKQEFLKWLNIDNEMIVLTSREEMEFLDTLGAQLKVFKITDFERQYSKLQCGDYRIDLYIPSLKVAIEYDEDGHKNYTYEQQELRQKLIEEELGCIFIRVSDDKTHIENSAIVLRELIKLNLLK